MKLVFADHAIPTSIIKSIFLAGPSPRDKKIIDWRHEALAYLKSINYTGTVFIPVPEARFYGKDDSDNWTYDGQVEWECIFRKIADIILFWVPRDIENGMPAFTTNIEFGEDLSSGKIVYGRPDNAEKCRYLDKRVLDINLPFFTSLSDTIDYTVQSLGDGAVRNKGEVYVPLFIWETKQFQEWYKNLNLAGNRLEKAHLLHHFTHKNQVFSYVLFVNIWVESEQRYKNNEFVLARKDLSTIVAYYKDNQDTYLAVVKEFRSSVNNREGFIYELPGGSSFEENISPQGNAQHEFFEEVGLMIEDINRFEYVEQRQIASTLSSHRSQVYRLKLNEEEFLKINEFSQSKKQFGIIEDSEITYVDMIKISQLKKSLMDYSMLGMIYEALFL